MIEFERRFFVDYDKFIQMIGDKSIMVATTYFIKQGYIAADENAVVRLRRLATRHSPGSWYITVKQNTTDPSKVNEHEYRIDDGEEMFDTLTQKIEKERMIIPYKNDLWIELDVFRGRHEGLVIAEVELGSEEDSEWLSANLPEFFTEEITGRKEYSNYFLSKN